MGVMQQKCIHCGENFSELDLRCPKCGQRVEHFTPTDEDMAAQLERIQAGWTEQTRETRSAYPVEHAEVTRCRHHPSGHRVIRDRKVD